MKNMRAPPEYASPLFFIIHRYLRPNICNKIPELSDHTVLLQ